MIEFKPNYTPGTWRTETAKSLSNGFRIFSGDRYIGFIGNSDDSIEQYEFNAAIVIGSKAMAEYMMDKAQELHLFLKDKWLADYPTSRAELDKILSILKDAGVDVVEK